MTTAKAHAISQQNTQQRLLINNRPASNFAALVIQQQEFWQYLSDKFAMQISDSSAADYVLKAFVAIESKSELDKNRFAYERFMLMFHDYREAIALA